ncbi:MAG: zf-HC2 domain-containing protein [Planctomycetota bacterium]
MSEHLSCREFIDFLSAHADGSLPADIAKAFEAHIEHCPPCKDYLGSFEHTVGLLHNLCPPEAEGTDAEEVPEGLVRAILAARRDA